LQVPVSINPLRSGSGGANGILNIGWTQAT
jgi:hypothetical protein